MYHHKIVATRICDLPNNRISIVYKQINQYNINQNSKPKVYRYTGRHAGNGYYLVIANETSHYIIAFLK